MASDERLIRIEDKVDKLSDKISSIDVTLAAQHEVLKEHTRRSTALEAIVEPIQKRDLMILGAAKVLAVIAAVVTTIIELFSVVKK